MAWVETNWEIANISDYMLGLGGSGTNSNNPAGQLNVRRIRSEAISLNPSFGRVAVTIVEPPNTQGRDRAWRRFTGLGSCIGIGAGLPIPDIPQAAIENVLGNLAGFANNITPLPSGGTRIYRWGNSILNFSDFEVSTLISVEISASPGASTAFSGKAYGFINLANIVSSAGSTVAPPPGVLIAGFVRAGVQLSGSITVGAQLNVCGFGVGML